VTHMTISVLDRNRAADAAHDLGDLHDAAAQVDDELLPCRTNNAELWFAESPTDVEHAKSLCQGCPVQAMCLDGALERREPWGVWGGELFLQGVVIPRKRPRGRPRKNQNEVAA
jgi:WhiB family redox-sensing transcriptional regulator